MKNLEGMRECTVCKTTYKLLKTKIKLSKKIQMTMSNGVSEHPFGKPYRELFAKCPYCKSEDVLKRMSEGEK